MPKRRGKHVAESPFEFLWSDDDGSLSAALIVASCLAVGIVSAIASALVR
jgi:hypothetical protein